VTKTSLLPAIRLAKLQDADQLKACIERAYQPVKSTLPDLPDVSAGITQDIETNHVLVAEIGGKFVGCAILAVQGDSGHLMNIAVDPAAKGKGLGRLLMTRVETHARSHGVGELHLATHIKMPGNVALYTHLGWSEIERKGNKVLMKKDL